MAGYCIHNNPVHDKTYRKQIQDSFYCFWKRSGVEPHVISNLIVLRCLRWYRRSLRTYCHFASKRMAVPEVDNPKRFHCREEQNRNVSDEHDPQRSEEARLYDETNSSVNILIFFRNRFQTD